MDFSKLNRSNRRDGYLPDWESEKTVVEVKLRLRSNRDLGAAILQIAPYLGRHPTKKGYLLLIEPGITWDRLQERWAEIMGALHPDIASRMCIAACNDDSLLCIPNDIPEIVRKQLKRICRDESSGQDVRLPKPDYSTEILKLMVYHWLLSSDDASKAITGDVLPFQPNSQFPTEPLTSKWLEEEVYSSYRTVASALKDIGSSLVKGSDRRVRLKYFPRHAWEKLLVQSDKSRGTMRFMDRSGQRRSPESLARRLQKLNRPDIAIGGVLGARRIYPALDLLGTPRLDLTMHCPTGTIDLGFIRQLDPALSACNSHKDAPTLTLHVLRRRDSFFKIDPEGTFWADPVECLLDLQDARLEHQALEFRNAIVPEGSNR